MILMPQMTRPGNSVNSFNPLDITSIEAWWGDVDASSPSYWVDLAGNYLGGTTVPPTYVANAVNGNPGLYFYDDRYTPPGPESVFYGASTPWSVFFIINTTTPSPGFETVCGVGADGFLNFTFFSIRDNSKIEINRRGADVAETISVTSGTLSPGYHVCLCYSDGTDLYVRVDGVDEASGADPASSMDSDRFSLGARWRTAIDGYLQGKTIIDLMLFSDVLSTNDMSLLESWGMAKIGT